MPNESASEGRSSHELLLLGPLASRGRTPSLEAIDRYLIIAARRMIGEQASKEAGHAASILERALRPILAEGVVPRLEDLEVGALMAHRALCAYACLARLADDALYDNLAEIWETVVAALTRIKQLMIESRGREIQASFDETTPEAREDEFERQRTSFEEGAARVLQQVEEGRRVNRIALSVARTRVRNPVSTAALSAAL